MKLSVETVEAILDAGMLQVGLSDGTFHDARRGGTTRKTPALGHWWEIPIIIKTNIRMFIDADDFAADGSPQVGELISNGLFRVKPGMGG